MKKFMSFSVALTLATAMWPVTAPLAQEVSAQADAPKSAKVNPSKPAPFEGVSALALAEQLGRLGEARQDPLALLAAASIAQANAATKEFPAPDQRGAESEGEVAAARRGPERWLALAEMLAAGDPSLTAVVEEVRSRGSRGDIFGPRSRSESISGGGSTSTRIMFEGGEVADVLVHGDGSVDLDLHIFDENGKDVCGANDDTDFVRCVFTPTGNSPYRVEVRNRSEQATSYWIISN